MIERSVSVYDRGKDGVYLHPSAYTDMGVLIAIPPFEHVSIKEKNFLLWEKIILLLERSCGIVPHPTQWNQLDPLIKLANCRNWKDFAKNAVYCTIDISEGNYLFTPHSWDGKGFTGLTSKREMVAINSDKSICITTLLTILS